MFVREESVFQIVLISRSEFCVNSTPTVTISTLYYLIEIVYKALEVFSWYNSLIRVLGNEKFPLISMMAIFSLHMLRIFFSWEGRAEFQPKVPWSLSNQTDSYPSEPLQGHCRNYSWRWCCGLDKLITTQEISVKELLDLSCLRIDHSNLQVFPLSLYWPDQNIHIR